MHDRLLASIVLTLALVNRLAYEVLIVADCIVIDTLNTIVLL